MYLDDILITSKTAEENLEVLEEVLGRLKQHGLTLQLQKCFFCKPEIEYLGHTISSEGVRPSSRRTKMVAEFPTPTDVHTLRQFLGLTGYFRKFIKDYAMVTTPLTKLLKKESSWIWEEE